MIEIQATPTETQLGTGQFADHCMDGKSSTPILQNVKDLCHPIHSLKEQSLHEN